jgi:hypothetical protein
MRWALGFIVAVLAVFFIQWEGQRPHGTINQGKLEVEIEHWLDSQYPGPSVVHCPAHEVYRPGRSFRCTFTNEIWINEPVEVQLTDQGRATFQIQ